MSDLYWLREEQMARLPPYFPKSHGKPQVDDRRLLSDIVIVKCRNRRRSSIEIIFGCLKDWRRVATR
jgi:hypothetical protein